MAMDSTSLFWLSGDPSSSALGPSLAKCERSNCAASIKTLASGAVIKGSIALDDFNVYWSKGDASTNQYSILMCPKTGCAGSPVAVVTNQPYVGAIALDATHIYWAGVATGTSSFVWTCPKAGCSGPPQRLASLPYGGFGLTVDEGNLYWANSGGDLMKCAVTGCAAPAKLASGKGGSRFGPGEGLVLDATCVYWGTGVSVMRVAK
jgi:hypothetical protein